jgi:NAD(P)-dependent dehydrogenase (short-subunit alcohol dehydrogenase family)
VVTGGGRGLSKAIALRLAEAGADVLIGDVDEDLAIAAATDLCERYPVTTVGRFMDVTDTPSVAASADRAVDQLGGIDIWVNNAGIFPSVPVPEMTEEAWDRVFAVNTRGVFVGSREAVSRMRGGVIVNVVSTAGFRGTAPGHPRARRRADVRADRRQHVRHSSRRGHGQCGCAAGDAGQPHRAARRARRHRPRGAVLRERPCDVHDGKHLARRRRRDGLRLEPAW